METIRPITVVEVPPFERLAAACMTESELDQFKYFIAHRPRAGSDVMPLYLLTVYPKSSRESLTAKEKSRLRAVARAIVAAHRGRTEQ